MPVDLDRIDDLFRVRAGKKFRLADHDPAWAEVWTKAAFLQGAADITDFVDGAGISALWVDDNGTLRSSASLRDRILWEAPDAR